MLWVKFPQKQYIDLSLSIHVLTAVAIETTEHLNLSTILVVSPFLSAKVSCFP